MKRDVNHEHAWEEIFKRMDVPYKKRYTGVIVLLCIHPGHNEKSPSLHCWPTGGFFCHGCHWKGSIYRFRDFLYKETGRFVLLPNEREMIMEELRRHGKAPDIERKLPPTFPHGNEYAEYAHLCATQWHNLNID